MDAQKDGWATGDPEAGEASLDCPFGVIGMNLGVFLKSIMVLVYVCVSCVRHRGSFF